MSRQEAIRVGINGFGRIGRRVFRQLLQREIFQVVGIDDLTNLEEPAYLLKCDSVHGWFARKIAAQEIAIQVDQQTILFFLFLTRKRYPGKRQGWTSSSNAAEPSAAV
jgi:glyceraldehyde 3-phosphate dehydrogenase